MEIKKIEKDIEDVWGRLWDSLNRNEKQSKGLYAQAQATNFAYYRTLTPEEIIEFFNSLIK